MLRLKINLKAKKIVLLILSVILWSGCDFNPTKTDITEDYNAITWTHWKAIMMDNCWIETMVMYDENLIVAGTNQGVFVSANGGKDWRKESAGLTTDIISVVKIDKNNQMYVGTNRNGFYYSDGPLK